MGKQAIKLFEAAPARMGVPVAIKVPVFAIVRAPPDRLPILLALNVGIE